MNASERETTITSTDADGLVRIWTAQRGHLGRLRRNPNFTEVASGHYAKTEWAEFTIPAAMWNPASGAKRATARQSEEQRAANVARLAAARHTRNRSGDESRTSPLRETKPTGADLAHSPVREAFGA